MLTIGFWIELTLMVEKKRIDKIPTYKRKCRLRMNDQNIAYLGPAFLAGTLKSISFHHSFHGNAPLIFNQVNQVAG